MHCSALRICVLCKVSGNRNFKTSPVIPPSPSTFIWVFIPSQCLEPAALASVSAATGRWVSTKSHPNSWPDSAHAGPWPIPLRNPVPSPAAAQRLRRVLSPPPRPAQSRPLILQEPPRKTIRQQGPSPAGLQPGLPHPHFPPPVDTAPTLQFWAPGPGGPLRFGSIA